MKNAIALIVAALGIKPGEDLPEWYTIFPAGEHEVEGQGRYLVTKAAWDLVRAGIERRGIDLVFDYEHQTLNGVKAPAAGWCTDWRWTDGVGIEAKIKWTDEAAEYLKKGEYRYYSPVFHVRQSDRLLFAVHSVALTNAPRTNHLQPLLAKLGAGLKEEEMDLLKMLIAALKMPENSTAEEVLAAVKALGNQEQKEKEVVAKAVIEALGIKETDVSTVVASIHALRQGEKNSVSRAEFDALQKKLTERDATEVVAAALKAGKITPDQKDWAAKYADTDPTGFATFVAKAPVVVPVTDLPKGDSAKIGITDETVLNVAKMMGVGTDDLKTFGGLQ